MAFRISGTFRTNIPTSPIILWDLWPERIQKVPTDAIDPAGGLPSVTPEDNVHVWKNYLKKYTIPTVEKVAGRFHKGCQIAPRNCLLWCYPPTPWMADQETQAEGQAYRCAGRPGDTPHRRGHTPLSVSEGFRYEAQVHCVESDGR